MSEFVQPGDYLVVELNDHGLSMALNPDPSITMAVTHEQWLAAARTIKGIIAIYKIERVV